MVVNIKQIELEFIGTGINDEFQAYIHIFDINGILLYHKKTYNGKIILSLKGDEGYQLIAKSYNDKINTFFYVDKKHKKYTFIFNRSIYNPSSLRTITFLLKDANYINSTTSDLSLAFNQYIKSISKSSELRIILPIYSENHFKHIIDLLNNGKLEKLELIISEEIFNSISCNELFKEKLIDNMNVKITVIKRRIKIFLTYSKEFMSLTLFFKDGHYDDSQILIAEDENAKKWASSLWNNYRKNYDTMEQHYVS